MQRELKVFENSQLGKIRTVDLNDEIWFVTKDVCDVLGVGNPSQVLTRLDEDEKNTLILNEDIGNPEKSVISESGLYNLILSSRKPQAKTFKRWVTREVLPSIRKTGSSNTGKNKYLDQLEGAKFIANDLKIDATSKIIMYEKVCVANGVDVTFLPTYTDETLTHSLTELIKEFGISTSTIKFNKLLMDCGFLEEKTRPSTKDSKIKKYKSLTDKGSKYGKNLINPKSPKETQPHYYKNTFTKLCKLVLNQEIIPTK